MSFYSIQKPMSSVTAQKLREHRTESGKVAGIGNELRTADDKPSGYDEQQEQPDVNASENVRPLPAWGNGYFAGENGTDEHGGKVSEIERNALPGCPLVFPPHLVYNRECRWQTGFTMLPT